jgi:hypothetical protein
VERALSRRPQLPRWAGLTLALVLFVGATALAIARLPPLEGVRWWLLVLSGLLAWPGVLANAAEYAVSASILGRRVPLLPATRVALVATAANLLPIPGAVLVRTRALKQEGASYRASIGSTATVGLGFIATTLVLAGGFQTVTGPRHAVGAFLAVGGIVGLVGTYLAIRSAAGRGRAPRLLGTLVVVETASVALKAARFFLVVVALGFHLTVSQALAMTIAQVVALAIGIFPSGLGITEVLTAAISPAVGLDAAVGLLASSVARVSGMACFAVLALVIALVERRRDVDGPPVEVAADTGMS